MKIKLLRKSITFIIVAILIVLLCTLVFGAGNINYNEIKKIIPFYKNISIINDNESKNIILGFWNFGFPVSSGKYGYVFLNNGEFIYFNSFAEGEGAYFGTYGKWKKNNYRLYLLPLKDFIYRNDDTYYAVKSQYTDWQLISDIRSYDCYWFPRDKDSEYYPSSISIKFFKDSKITNYVQRYFKLGDQKEFESIIKSFRETKIQ